MTKADLVDRVTAATGLTKRDVAVVVDRFLDAVGAALSGGSHIEIRGFGSFKVKSRGARIARNPRTGTTVEVPPKLVPYFKVSKELRRMIEEADPVLEADSVSSARAEIPEGVPAPGHPSE
ncbi:MAG: integration host factor subunit beta [Gemmatimonadetes bacterium]|jgi:integration host factor subunit beta|nr:integration host factor subunit beta [Gemmatimonadota bacterium]